VWNEGTWERRYVARCMFPVLVFVEVLNSVFNGMPNICWYIEVILGRFQTVPRFFYFYVCAFLGQDRMCFQPSSSLSQNNNKGVIILSASTCNGKREAGSDHTTGVSTGEKRVQSQ
jgi:hypothetical protein